MKLIKKQYAALAALFLCLIIMSGCAPDVSVSSPNDAYTVTAAELSDSFDGITPPEGDRLLLIQIVGSKNNIENFEQDFFSYQKVSCQVSDGVYSAPCKSVAYAYNDDTLSAVLIFEVPDSFAKKFSLIGDTIGVTELTVTRS